MLSIATGALAQEEFNSSSGSAGGSAQSCKQAYDDTQTQIVEARTLVDANFRKREIDCSGDPGCRRSAGEEYDDQMRQIAKQQIDATTNYQLCTLQAQGRGGASVASPGSPGSPQNPLTGYIRNSPGGPHGGNQPPQNSNGANPPPSNRLALPPPVLQALQTADNALGKAFGPQGSQKLQQAGQAAAQVDKTINQGLNDADRMTRPIAENMAKQWTELQFPQQQVPRILEAWAGNAIGAGLGAGFNALRGGIKAGTGVGQAARQAGSAAVKAAVEEGRVTAGAAPALPANSQVASSSANDENAPSENNRRPPSNTDRTGSAPRQSPPPLSGTVAQMGEQFAKDFGSDAPPPLGQTGYGSSPAPPCYAKNACFPTAIAQARLWATGQSSEINGVLPLGKPDTSMGFRQLAHNFERTGTVPSGKPDMLMSGNKIEETLRQQFGGAAAANNPAYTAVERMAQRQGIPIPVSRGRLNQIMSGGHNGNQWLVFIKQQGGEGHVFNARIVNNQPQFLDATQKMDGSLWFSNPLQGVFLYQLY